MFQIHQIITSIFYPPQEQEYLQKSREVWDKTWEMLNTQDNWKREAGNNLESGCVHSRRFPGIGKVYKLQVRARIGKIHHVS